MTEIIINLPVSNGFHLSAFLRPQNTPEMSLISRRGKPKVFTYNTQQYLSFPKIGVLDASSIARDPIPLLERSSSLAVAEEVDFGTSITSLFEDEMPHIYDTSELHVTLDESSLDLSQPHEYELDPTYASVEPQTLFRTPFGSEPREGTTQPSLSGGFLKPQVHSRPILPSLKEIPPSKQSEESRECNQAKLDDYEDSRLCSLKLEETDDFGSHDELNISHTEQSQPVKPLHLACPYFKRDPDTYGQRGTCRGKAYKTTHRLK